jgi:hypothetical protein
MMRACNVGLVGSADILPALSGILPDSQTSGFTESTSDSCVGMRTRAGGNMPPVEGKMPTLPYP